jgi:hypothetical protein
MTMAATAPSALPVPAPAGGNQVAVVDIPDDDVPPPRWGQWESLPAPAPDGGARDEGGRPRDVGAPDARRRGLVVPRRLPSSGGIAARPEEERERVNAPLAHFSEAQAEQALWQEFRNHGASLNRALNEALRIHGGPAWRVFQVCGFLPDFAVFPPLFLLRLRFP